MIKRSDEKEGQNEENVIKRNDEKEGEEQEDVFKRSDAKEDQKEKDTIDSNEKGGQKKGDVLERSVEQQHDFDSMKGNAIEIPNPKDVRLSKRRKVRLMEIMISYFLSPTTRKDSSSSFYKDFSCIYFKRTNCKLVSFLPI